VIRDLFLLILGSGLFIRGDQVRLGICHNTRKFGACRFLCFYVGFGVSKNKSEESNAVYERHSLVLGVGDSHLLEDLTRMARYHRWVNPNRSTVIRALIRVAASAYQGGIFPVTEAPWALFLHDQLPRELAKIKESSARRGPMPGSKRKGLDNNS
jgi:hypothetical protein